MNATQILVSSTQSVQIYWLIIAVTAQLVHEVTTYASTVDHLYSSS